LHPLIEEHIKRNALTSGDNSEARYIKSLNTRISGALMDGRLEGALQLLKDFKTSGQVMKLGTV